MSASRSKGKHEPSNSDGGNGTDDIGDASTLSVEGSVAGPAARAGEPDDRIGRAERSADHASPAERSTDRARPVGRGAAGISTSPAPEIEGRADAVDEALGLEVQFSVSTRPQTLGRYVVLGVLGKGGMGTVLEGFDRTLDRRVAIKVLRQGFDARHTARLLREAQAMAKLSHPHVVQVYEADTVGGQTFVAMELVQGQTLADWMRQDPPPHWRQCVEVFIQVGQGLAAAHAEGLVHRDFKPSNAIVDDKGRARVLDFGLVRQVQADPVDEDDGNDEPRGLAGLRTEGDDSGLGFSLTRSGAVLGTPAYMSPEQMKGHEADARSDQFSLCVSLYEAVYGERPFEGATLMELMTSMGHGNVRPAPPGSAVPARLRTLLLRGLAHDPGQRWPSMEALLAQWCQLVAPRTRRWVALGGVVGVTAGLVGLGSVVIVPWVLEMQQRCTGARAQMDDIWDDARRQQTKAAILGTARSFAADTWERVEPRLDDYADAWMDAHTDACEATSVRQEQTHEQMSLRMRCLGRRRTALRAAVDVLADADAKVVEHAVGLVAGLPLLARCDDLEWLERQDQRVPLPEDPNVAAAVQAQRARLAKLEAMAKAGRYAEALEQVEPVVRRAEVLGYPPLRAEALNWRGTLRDYTGQYVEAEEDLWRAHALAVEHHHDSVALDTAQSLTSLMGLQLVRPTEGRQWANRVVLPLARRSGEPIEEATCLDTLGSVFRSEGHLEQARAHYQRALAIRHEVLGPDHPHVATSLNNLGSVFRSEGDLEKARVHLQRALAIWKKVLGPDHPYVATSLDNLANVFQGEGDLEKARVYHQRALAIRREALGPDHPHVAMSLGNLGNTFAEQGDFDNARAHYQRALAIFEEALGPDHPYVAGSLDNLGSGFESEGDLEKARVHYQRALAIRQKALGLDHPDVAYTLYNLGSVFVRQGDWDEARVDHQRALAIFDKALGPDHPDGAFPLVGLATVALNTGDLASARAHAERAVSIREAATVTPDLLAQARFVLAQALWSERSERVRARALAEQARDAFIEAGAAKVADLAEIEAWLAAHWVE